MKKKFLKSFPSRWPFLLIILAVLVFFYPVWLRGHVPLPADLIVASYYPWRDYFGNIVPTNPITTDAASYSFPMRLLAVELLASGKAPLWNPFILAGTPLLANFQSAPFSPTNFVYFLFDKLTAWSLQVILQHILAASFVFILLRHWKVSRLGSFLGGVVFAFSGFALIWSEWNAHSLAAAFIPLILFFQDRFLESGKIRRGAALSLALGLQLLSGYPQLVLYTFVAMALLWVVRSGWQKLRNTILLAIFTILGIGLASLQILPGAELLSLSQRQLEPIPRNWAFLPWEKIITFIAPDYFGNHATGNYWGPQNYTSNTGFVGVVALLLALLGLNVIKKRRSALFSFLLAAVSLALSFPNPLSVYIWESGLFGLQAGTAHRALVLFTLGISLLAGFGFDYLASFKKINWRAHSLLYFLVAGFGLYALGQESDHSLIAMENLVFPTIVLFLTTVLFIFFAKKKFVKVAFALLPLLLILELFGFGWRFTPFSARELVYPRTPVLEFLDQQVEEPFRVTGIDVMPVNQGMALGLEFPGGYDAVYPLRMAQFIAALNSGSSQATPQDRYAIVNDINSPLVDLMNTRYVLVKNDFDYDEAKFKTIFTDKSVSVLENIKSPPRAFMVYDWEVIKREGEQLERLLEEEFLLGKKAVLSSPPGIKTSAGAQFSLGEVLYEPNKSSLKVTTDKEGVLFVSDAWYPGWKAFVDGAQTRLVLANYAFRGVAVPQGEHHIEFIYSPQSFKIGKWLSIAAAGALVALLFFPKANYERYGKKSS